MKNKSLFDSFSNALEGALYCLQYERNFKIHFALAFIVLLMSLFLDLNLEEYLILIVVIVLVIVCEMINTAIETLVNLICGQTYHEKAKIAKDCAAAAVFVSAVCSVIVGYFLLFKKAIRMGFSSDNIKIIRQTPVHVSFVCITVTFMLTLLIKIITKSENYFRGGMPSSHAAIAFSLATAILFLVDNSLAIFLAYCLAFLVAQSRVEGKIHSLLQVIFGSIIGVFVTAILFQMSR